MLVFLLAASNMGIMISVIVPIGTQTKQVGSVPKLAVWSECVFGELLSELLLPLYLYL